MELFRLSHIFLVIVTKYVKYWQIRVFNRNIGGHIIVQNLAVDWVKHPLCGDRVWVTRRVNII